MKLFVVLVSALALVVNGKVLSDDADRVMVVDYQPEKVGGYAAEVPAVQEAGDVAPQSVYVDQAADAPAMRVFATEEEQKSVLPKIGELVNQEFEVPEPPSSIYIPIITRSCTNSACAYICQLLGFKNGVCVSTSTCQCSN